MIPDSAQPHHVAVMPAQVMAGLAVAAGSDAIDCTLGAGGHARAILEAISPDGRLLALDRDATTMQTTVQRLSAYAPRLVARHAAFDELDVVAAQTGFGFVQAVLFDLGISSDQLDDPARGFSFASDGPLDMRMDPSADIDAAAIVNDTAEDELADVLYHFGDEPRSRRIARAIVRNRPVTTTGQLAQVVARAAGYRGGRTHPATRTFQAVRIAVNDEVAMLTRALPKAVNQLSPHGRIVVVSFHSIEDRIVKQTFRFLSASCICPPSIPECRCDHAPTLRVITRRPLTPEPEELALNPRARSARLRVAERLPILEAAA